MGLFSNVLLLPLAPVRGVLWLGTFLQELAENEVNDPGVLRSKLAEAEEAHRRGEISAAELERVEDAVFSQLMAMEKTRGGMR